MGEDDHAKWAEPPLRNIRFAAFELDVRAGELRKHGVRIRLQEQPSRVLLMLLERPGEIVLRDEIRKKLWPNDTIVEFAHSINAAIQRLRDTLGDSADNPRYVETVARRGYRFIGELAPERKDQSSPALQATPTKASPPPEPQADTSSPDISDLSGHTIAHYRVYEKLGSGGMGEVYRARDSKLARDVALKVLPEEFAHDADRMARFEREAQVLASLNHPNIATIYGVEEANGIRALVMELVEGKALAERIARGAVPLEEALGIARQIVDALEAAHEKGIVHRDLKPANIKVTPQGVVKLLDFGLATVMQGPVPALDDPENSPTRTATLSTAGVILGTAAYMSPEQARGEAVDKRSDVWAFGVVLYELLTGKRLFEGETTTEILSAVLTLELDWKRVPAKAQRLLRSCLDKDPKRRLRDIGDAWRQLEETPKDGNLRHRELLWALVALLLVAAAVAIFWLRTETPSSPAGPIRVTIPTPDGTGEVAISPDGSRLSFSAVEASGISSLWVRSLNSSTSHRLPYTERANNPFWSADSQYVAFFADDKLKKIAVAGGVPLVLADAPFAHGGSWAQDGTILFSSNGKILRTSSTGATPVTVEKDDRPDTRCLHPQFLPNGRDFLFTLFSAGGPGDIYSGSLDSQQRKPILSGVSLAWYSRPGYLLFVRDGIIVAQRFDAQRIRLLGERLPVTEDVGFKQNGSLISASNNGVLVYRSLTQRISIQPAWLSRAGARIKSAVKPDEYFQEVVSPDGARVLFQLSDKRLLLLDLKTGVLSTLYSEKDDAYMCTDPVWFPDSRRIMYSVNHRWLQTEGRHELYTLQTDSAQPELLFSAGKNWIFSEDVSPDGHVAAESDLAKTPRQCCR